ncbi:MAG TPA: DUF4349 domain-containing protein [Bacillota bacterium]|nr:DUF4349 domain-containing protein [Bacillota bacterium]
MKKLILALIIAAILITSVLFSTSCAQNSNSSKSEDYNPPRDTTSPPNGYDYDKNYEEEKPQYDDGKADASIPEEASRKVIKYVTVTLETLEYDKVLESLKSRCTASGGYIESANETGVAINKNDKRGGERFATLVFRIPADVMGDFEDYVKSLGNVLSSKTDTKDVTDSYFDIEARLASLEIQKERYLELLDRAEDMNSIVVLTDALTDVLYQIESYTSTLKKYDSLIAYSTITINLYEVIEYTDQPLRNPSFGERISDAFSKSIEAFIDLCADIAVGITAAIPFLVIPALAAIIIIIIFCSRKKKAAAQAKEQ